MDINTNLTVLTLGAVFSLLSGNTQDGQRSVRRMHRLLAAHKGLFTPEVFLKYLKESGIDIEPKIEDGDDEAMELDEVIRDAQAKLPKQPSPPPAVTEVVGTRDNKAVAEEAEKITDVAVDAAGNTMPGANDDGKTENDKSSPAEPANNADKMAADLGAGLNAPDKDLDALKEEDKSDDAADDVEEDDSGLADELEETDEADADKPKSTIFGKRAPKTPKPG